MTATLVKIPVIDFAPFLMGTIEDQQQVAQAIFAACHEVGFMYLTNSGIPQDLLNQTWQASQAFFARPIAEKTAVAWSDAVSNRGYIGIERETLNPNRPGDFKEAFNVGQEDLDVSQPVPLDAVSNYWPLGDDAFRETILTFFSACNITANHVFEAFALALQVPRSFISDRHVTQAHILRLLHYPAIAQTLAPEQIRAGEHSDYGSITLLFQDAVGGLEVKTVDGQWVAAPCIPDTVLVNTGDLMQRWSNDVFRSTLHRVNTPTETQVNRSRYSIAFFCQPDPTAEITCIDSCQSPAQPPHYEPILAGDHLISSLKATY
jgi:isopenicillin N synthase-like dioxygenase